MAFARITLLPLTLATLAACESEAEQKADTVEDRIEMQAEQSAAASGDTVVALGLTERQLLDADLVAQDGSELGDVEQVRRDASGTATELLIEIEDSSPDRYVIVPLDKLTARGEGNNADLQTSMAARDLAAMPDAPVNTR